MTALTSYDGFQFHDVNAFNPGLLKDEATWQALVKLLELPKFALQRLFKSDYQRRLLHKGNLYVVTRMGRVELAVWMTHVPDDELNIVHRFAVSGRDPIAAVEVLWNGLTQRHQLREWYLGKVLPGMQERALVLYRWLLAKEQEQDRELLHMPAEVLACTDALDAPPELFGVRRFIQSLYKTFRT